MRAVVLVCAAAATAAAASAASSDKETAELRRITAKYATCVVRQHHDKASVAVLSMASNREIMGPMAQIIDGNCLIEAVGGGAQMRFAAESYQFALADALVNADFRAKGSTSFDDRLPLAQPPYPAVEPSAEQANARPSKHRLDPMIGYRRQYAQAWLARYAECVARHDPEGVRYWLLTPPDTPEEVSRIKALQPTLNACMGDGTMRFNRIGLRGSLAINYYRLAMATAIPAAGNPS